MNAAIPQKPLEPTQIVRTASLFFGQSKHVEQMGGLIGPPIFPGKLRQTHVGDIGMTTRKPSAFLCILAASLGKRCIRFRFILSLFRFRG